MNCALIIAGPCSAETEQQVMTTAKALAACGVKYFRAGLWKPRTQPGSFEGVGEIGLQWLRRSPSSQNLVTENYFVLNLGVTFNERWFMKFKIQ